MCIQYGIADIYRGLELYSRLVLGAKHTLVGIYVGVLVVLIVGENDVPGLKISCTTCPADHVPSRVVRRNLKGKTIIFNFTEVTIYFVFQDDNFFGAVTE